MVFAIVMGLFATVRHAFSIDIPMPQPPAPTVAMTEDNERATADEEEWEEEDRTEPLTAAVTETPQQEAPSTTDSTIIPTRRIRGVWSYTDCFPDVQDVQIQAAKRHGIKPVRTREDANRLVKKHKLVNITHSPFYTVDPLTHSIPYLVPRAQHLLNTICINFLDSCHVKGIPPHLPMVTSVLRTTDDVSRLQRGNQNATTNSCHCYGTTVDIAYNRFMPVTGTYTADAELLRWNEPMKKVLAEVLNDLRLQNKCYVKYEVKQGCFHLTCR